MVVWGDGLSVGRDLYDAWAGGGGMVVLEDYEHAKAIVADARKKGIYVGEELVKALEQIIK